MPDFRNFRNRAERAFPNIKPNDVLNRVRAIVGSKASIPITEEGKLAVSALEKLQDPNLPDPTPAELAALELMIRMTRPAPLVRQGRPGDIDKVEQKEVFPHWDIFQNAFRPFAHAIGRVDRASVSLAQSESIGTGFLVKDGLLMTNKHVLMDLSRGTGLLEPGQGVVRFQVEFGDFSPDMPVRIMKVASIHPTLDVALLAVETAPLSAGSLMPRISTAAPSTQADVVVAGFPQNDPARNPLFIGPIFGTDFGVLRVAPGQIASLEASGFTHDCSTLGGNSGSPVFDLRTSDVVGLHRGGAFLWTNEAVNGALLASFVAAQEVGKGAA